MTYIEMLSKSKWVVLKNFVIYSWVSNGYTKGVISIVKVHWNLFNYTWMTTGCLYNFIS
jgi:hypothetical protein